MRNLFTNSGSIIDAGTARSGTVSRPHTMQIVNGAAWVTIEGEPHDYWLSTGDTLPVQPGRLVVVEAARNDVTVSAAPVPQGPLQAIGSMARHLRRSIQLRLKRPIAGCASAVNTIGQQVCGSQVSGSGWRRLGHL